MQLARRIGNSLKLIGVATLIPFSGCISPTGEESRLETVTNMPGLVGFWTFGEDAGQARRSTGTAQPHPLREIGGPIPRVSGGPFTGYAAYLDGSHYFAIDHEDTGELNICGPNAQVSMFAVIKLEDMSRPINFAGMWDEGHGPYNDTSTRQYALHLNMPLYGGAKRLTPHVSSEGGVTRRADGSPLPYNVDYAVTKSEVPVGEWVTIGFTYNGEYLTAYLNGRLETRELDPVKDNREDRYFTSEGPDGGPRGMNPVYHNRGIFCYDAESMAEQKPRGGSPFTVGSTYVGGSELSNSFIGKVGAVAVFGRALTEVEMKQLHEAAGLSRLAQ